MENGGSRRLEFSQPAQMRQKPLLLDEDHRIILDRFWRKDKSRSRISGGTGLGLAIAKQLIEAQGGKISAQNLPEGGLRVWIELNK